MVNLTAEPMGTAVVLTLQLIKSTLKTEHRQMKDALHTLNFWGFIFSGPLTNPPPLIPFLITSSINTTTAPFKRHVVCPQNASSEFTPVVENNSEVKISIRSEKNYFLFDKLLKILITPVMENIGLMRRRTPERSGG